MREGDPPVFILQIGHCNSLNLIINGVHQSQLGCWGHKSVKVKLGVWTMLHTRCASTLSYWKTQLLSAMCFVLTYLLVSFRCQAVEAGCFKCPTRCTD